MRAAARLLVVAFVLVALPPAAAAAYEGRLFDAHVHLDEDGAAGRLAPLLAPAGVERALLFVGVDPDDPEGSWDEAREDLSANPGRFALLFHVDPKRPADLEPARLARVADRWSGTFRGVGEMAFYRDPWREASLDDAPWPDVLRFAAERGLVVMLHPRMDQRDELARALAASPGATVLVHGPDSERWIADLLRAHDNLWYTLDTATLLAPPEGGSLQYAPSKEAFVSAFDARRGDLLDQAVARWAPVVAAAPDRVTWGTDAALGWHFDADVHARLVAFGRDFAARLPEAQREPYAWSNAARLLGEPPSVPPPEDEVPAPGAPLAALALAAVALLARRARRPRGRSGRDGR